MEISLKLFPDKFCRTCLSESTNMKSLNSKIDGENRTLLDVLCFVANLSIKNSDKRPRHICRDCEVLMCKAEAFKRRCFESESILDTSFNNDKDSLFSLEIDQETVIKNEIPIEIDKIDVNNTPLPSNSRLEPSNSNLFDVFQPPLQNHETKNANTDQLVRIVKVESINEYDDTSIDTEDVELFEAIPIESKNENVTNESKVFPCTCGSIFHKKEAYKSHLKTNYCNKHKINLSKRSIIANKGKNTCKDCNVEFDTARALKLHQRSHKNNGTDYETGHFECSMCMRKFSRKSSYTSHMKHHDEKSKVKYTCDTCKREFQHKAHLDNHILNVHTREKGFSCEICSTNFATEESLELHKDSHKIEKKHQCNLCKKAFYMLSTLNDHMRTHTGEKPFLCSICGRGFSQKTNLAQHMRRHQGLKPFKCGQCDRSFVSKGELVAHNRKHSGAHPFVCDDCGSGFTTSSSLRKHRRIHTGERPYACDLCSMRFAASGTLTNHRRTHTGEKPFQCSYCEKAFVQRHDLISHIRCHTGERPYVCECGQSFRKASALKTHAKLHGKDTLQRDLSVLQGANMLLTGVHCVGNTLGQ